MASTSITFDVLARTQGEEKLARMGRAAETSGGQIGGMSDKMKRLAKAGALAAAAAAGFAIKYGVEAVGAAGDLNETVSKSRQIFGAQSKALEDLAGKADRMFGMSKQQALDAMSTFGVFGKSAGLAGKDLSRFSGSFTGLAADMASFNNTTPQEAIDAIGAALRGESEPLRRYGILLDDATLRQEALKLGLVKTTKEALTPQQKVLAAQQAIWKQAGDQVGDFGRTSGGLANQQRILQAQLANVKTEIGQKLLPVAVKLMTWMNDSLIPGAKTAYAWLKEKLGPAFAAVGEGAEKLWKWLGPKLGPALEQVRDWIEQLRPEADSLATTWREKLANAVDAVKQAFNDAQPFFHATKEIMQEIGPVVRDVVYPALKKLAEMHFDNMVDGIKAAGKVMGFFGRLMVNVWNNQTQPVLKFMADAIATILRKLGEMFSALGSIKGAPDWIGKTGDALQRAADKAEAVGDNIRKIPREWSTNYELRTHYSYTGTPPPTKGGPIDPAGRSIGGSSGRSIGGSAPRSLSGTSGRAATVKDLAAMLSSGLQITLVDGDAGRRAIMSAPGVI